MLYFQPIHVGERSSSLGSYVAGGKRGSTASAISGASGGADGRSGERGELSDTFSKLNVRYNSQCGISIVVRWKFRWKTFIFPL